jgi:hypothetical protein
MKALKKLQFRFLFQFQLKEIIPKINMNNTDEIAVKRAMPISPPDFPLK